MLELGNRVVDGRIAFDAYQLHVGACLLALLERGHQGGLARFDLSPPLVQRSGRFVDVLVPVDHLSNVGDAARLLDTLHLSLVCAPLIHLLLLPVVLGTHVEDVRHGLGLEILGVLDVQLPGEPLHVHPILLLALGGKPAPPLDLFGTCAALHFEIVLELLRRRLGVLLRRLELVAVQHELLCAGVALLEIALHRLTAA